MQKQLRLMLSLLSLLGGASIVFISLTAVSPVLSSETSASTKRFYFNEPILPDHVAYPLFMIADKVALEAATPDQVVQIKLEYGLRRLDYARQLVEKNDYELALTTLTKSQKYIIEAAQEVLHDDQATDEAKQQVLKVLIRYSEESDKLAASFADRTAVDQLLKECEGLKLQLRQSLDR
jgi:hypothetical protein